MSSTKTYVVDAANPTGEEKRLADEKQIINDVRIEQEWAVQAVKYSEVYMKLLKAIEPEKLKLSPIDDEIYRRFREVFPSLNVEHLDEDEMKSKAGKEKWRPLLMEFKGRVKDWDLGTLLRIDSKKDMSEENSTIAPRIQFLCIELARNKEGFNKAIHEQ
ncbi:putative protein PBDC1 [Monocercomonoides exilis]|uniref:putative protein PBDC1 n=1 Tax=Monocercomonoides exilis TaxID=2049356 RepID=UPI003559F85C|nr:putative protein PBDC1 [Monocercomonoides exilis]|eukprot:MONOS_2390.1-p1 / transcript=MONOS_2390.1 / gene=MONOS_2390 / organism=Monocercomonoides_exilis_PA203 / gene_product=RGD1562502 protein / transcript_product=RGD1562502 protein / location=Mono_scaffold00049:57437-58069(-) / protein_length=159 / sequence_SO=supercontig / SO=protein_coding / is_pseudo=false